MFRFHEKRIFELIFADRRRLLAFSPFPRALKRSEIDGKFEKQKNGINDFASFFEKSKKCIINMR